MIAFLYMYKLNYFCQRHRRLTFISFMCIYNLCVFVDIQVLYISIRYLIAITQKHDLSKNSKHNKNKVKYKRGF